MARHLAPYSIGHAVTDPYIDGICDLVQGMDWTQYTQQRDAILALRNELFLEDGSGVRALLNKLSDSEALESAQDESAS